MPALGLVLVRTLVKGWVAHSVRECVVFVLTGRTFIFIGLQMRDVVSIIATEEQLLRNRFGAVMILAVTIAVRMIWVFPAARIPRLLSAKLRSQREINMEETRIKSISNAT